jgi:hypothetical protein
MKNTARTVARPTKCWATLFLAGTAAVAALGAGPSLAQADRYDRDRSDRDRDSVRFRENRVDVRYDDCRDRVEDHRVWVEPVYRTVCDKVWCEPVYRTECEKVWCEAVYQTVCEKVWCPDRYEVRDTVCYERGRRVIHRERILVERGHYVNQERQVLLTAGHWDNVERRICVSEGHWTTVERRECVTPGHWETVAVRHDRYEPRWNLGLSLNF